ncbi:ankyrin repeat-containing domain protein [Podospora fimiseda]|uniref:Ankyrin repeat-containing domain protein n=1 Tax=Podospora fimiseda TaxID=252190 RepID=A0AAN6YL75_9PEZI|nr:ankyrin repeat-containing domain protein [Podospora fimiseda]
MQSFNNLPTELILDIAEILDNGFDWSRLSRTSTRLHHIINPILYHRFAHRAIRWGVEQNQLSTIKLALQHGKLDPAEALNEEQDLKCSDNNADWRDWGRARREMEALAGLDEPSTQGVWKTTLLHLACASGHNEVVGFLMDHGARLDAPSMHLCACVHLHNDLWQHPPYSRSESLDLFCPKWLPLHTTMCSRHPSTALLLLERGAPFHVLSDGRETLGLPVTAMHWAAAHGHLEVVRYLIERYKENPTDEGPIGYPNAGNNIYTAMHYLALCPDYKSVLGIAQELNAIGIDINEERGTRDILFDAVNDVLNPTTSRPFQNFLATPIALACKIHNYAAARALFHAGADPSATATQMNCLQLALDVQRGLPYLFRHLRENKVWNTTNKERAELVRDLIKAGVSVDPVPPGPESLYRFWPPSPPLMLAAQNGLTEELRFFLELGKAKPEIQDASRKTPLMYAAGGCHPACVKLLIAAGANVHAWTGQRTLNSPTRAVLQAHTPYRSGIAEDRLKVIDILLKEGAVFGMPGHLPIEWQGTAFGSELARVNGGFDTWTFHEQYSYVLRESDIMQTTHALEYILEHCEHRNFSPESWMHAVVDILTGKHSHGWTNIPFCRKLADAGVRLGYHLSLDQLFLTDWAWKQIGYSTRHLRGNPNLKEALEIFGIKLEGFNALLDTNQKKKKERKKSESRHVE